MFFFVNLKTQGLNKFESLETILLNRLNLVSEKLQRVEMDCGLVVELYDSLKFN